MFKKSVLSSCKKAIWLLVLVFLLMAGGFFFRAGPAYGEETLTFYTATTFPMRDILTERIQEAFRRMGLRAVMVQEVSSQRALMRANFEGDGDPVRVPNIKEIAPKETTNLLQVPETILVMELVAFSKNKEFVVEGWHSLRGYHNGARVGAKILEKNIPGKRTFLPTTVQLVKLLDAGRIDTMVEWRRVGVNTLAEMNLSSSIRELLPPIKSQEFYMYLHKQHRNLIPELKKTLMEMKKDGTFDRLEKKVMRSSIEAKDNQ